MPAKNTIKTYVADSYYHLYNRGVEKRVIFQNEKDYKVFLSYLKFYLSEPLRGESPKWYPSQQLHNHAKNITLLAYCLMPNHFHLFVKQSDQHGINHFMRSLLTRYSMYFNKKYARVGSLFQGPYKAAYIDNEIQYLYLSKYIHRNPLSLSNITIPTLTNYPYSSYSNYLGNIHQTWINPQEIITYFPLDNHQAPYRQYVEESENLATEISVLGNLALDHDT